jgi:hypothetical protein
MIEAIGVTRAKTLTAFVYKFKFTSVRATVRYEV